MGQEPVAPPIGIPPESSEEAVAPPFESKTSERMALAADLAPNTFCYQLQVARSTPATESQVEYSLGHLVRGLAGAADQKASRDSIAAEFLHKAINARPDSLLLFYFSGHKSADDTGGVNLVANDSSKDCHSMLKVDVLKALFKVSAAKVGVLLLDA